MLKKEGNKVASNENKEIKGENNIMKKEVIYIHKKANEKKDAVRVNSKEDIPFILQKAIRVVGNKLKLQCVEGDEIAEFGSVIGYEKSEKTPSGYNCWVIGNAATNLVEKDGVFYKKATIMKASLVRRYSIPSFLNGADLKRNSDGSWTIKTSWGESTGFPGESYWVLYGENEDGSPDANILTKTEKSFREYIVCDSAGNDIGFLFELDAQWNE